ncbi:UDP-glucose 4-epimerase GalE [Rhabdochromatium marinum]|uniref:UDP-glucose 4-epimerase GalE n=1 Tax=Rhabdochromatium marinum TaxID=48729 RepID=UPI001907C154|nr:UDP-glucose 4-epimerase GalE [Rhabdochromatium marinum]MBK1649869.1 UDP-glucose 4-epimerase GalE [Rhabdochromatium marinum]
MPNILVTGGAGYIGSHVNKALHSKGYKTIVLDNLVYGHSEFVKWGNFFLVDLQNKDSLKLIFKKHQIDAVMHFAAYAYVGESVHHPSKYYNNNVANTLNLLDTMLECDVKKIIFSSTCATYGLPQELPIPETHQQSPINPYGRSKLMIENILADYQIAYNLNYVVLRYFNAAGADPDGIIGEWHEPETHLIPLVLQAALREQGEVKIFGTDYNTKDGTCIRDYIHVTDLADAHILALEYLCNGGTETIFNLGNGDGFSVKDVIESARTITQREIAVKEFQRREGDPPILIGDAKKAKKILGWSPSNTCLDSIIDTAWGWHQRLA